MVQYNAHLHNAVTQNLSPRITLNRKLRGFHTSFCTAISHHQLEAYLRIAHITSFLMEIILNLMHYLSTSNVPFFYFLSYFDNLRIFFALEKEAKYQQQVLKEPLQACRKVFLKPNIKSSAGVVHHFLWLPCRNSFSREDKNKS